ncbi:magnesium transporter CorA family protein [Microlunatus parietis]|uniref:Magnesium transporter n=1 Tax=Microlunatus parietis TaxID=682979 RepID=A0A7Y9I9Y5_9ACTN|nr:CorA family divalent cation transporter [Microlunatus parietis]NYE72805.1 magnesium transporter [Microlunatus parietis]
MSTPRTSGVRVTPMSRVWTGQAVIAEDLDGDDLGDVLELHSGSVAWWVVPREPGLELRLRPLAQELDLDAGAIHDLLATDRRAKYETFGGTRLLITSVITVDRDAAELTADPLAMVITDRVLICLAGPGPATVRPARALVDDGDRLADGGVADALQVLVKCAVQSQADAVEWLESASDELAGALFQERPLSRDEQLRAFRLRRALTELRRIAQPTLDVLTDLSQDTEVHDQLQARHWTLLAERQDRVVRATEAVADALASVFDTSLALASQRMNTDVKRLTGWAAIIAVPTLVTGFVGMNVAFPGDGTQWGFWLYLVIMVAAAAVLFILFRRHNWI